MPQNVSDTTRDRTAQTSIIPAGQALAIGSMPHQDPAQAVALILDACPEAPCWPQLPALGFQENMYAQFSEGFPGLQIDVEAKKIFFSQPEAGWDKALTQFYENYFEAEKTGNFTPFAVSDAYAKGFNAFLDKMSQQSETPCKFIKGQITGPLTFGLSIMDEKGLPAFFNDTLADVIQKGILMKTLWQIEQLKPYGTTCIIFVDEPILSAFGSAAYITLTREKAVSVLKETFAVIKQAGCLVGSHCCGNTEWSLMVDAGVDIINFDAYLYKEAIALYADSLSTFINRGGYLAWGIVPSQSMEERPSPEELFELVTQGITMLSEKGVPREGLLKNLLVTPSCGLGTLAEQEAERALKELKELDQLIRGRV